MEGIVRVNWFKLSEKKDKEFLFFELEKAIWNNLIKKEQKRAGISFDMENNEPNGDIKEKKLDINIKASKDNIYEYKILSQLYSAGGDWENPVTYFRCQNYEKNVDSNGWRLSGTFVYIPSHKEGNLNVVKNDKGNWVASQDCDGEKINDNQL